ncbi:AraC family transcriptional regulator [Massilia sp. Root418]|jgi:AraC-like DNA-binding protein|uniref:AraC family transcriptional regulator n=1 Tax=Massilia sp. Root418 TaxID=1736532 RepID=UPI0006FDC081|nr:helix-turn-helix domain-containing protein [Massilia sp. Root418]KQW87968.1 AraC family transcriptional regulator [Massilia sp. Root418]
MTKVQTAQASQPVFWRDAALPFIEARSIRDGRSLCYARHTHATFSIGAITGGVSTYWNRRSKETVGAGSVVIINPEDAHACNPAAGQPWSYRMFYVDVAWLTALQHELGFSRNADFRAFSVTSSTALFAGLNRLYDTLTSAHADALQKQSAALGFFLDMQQTLDPAPAVLAGANGKLQRAAEFISDNCTRLLSLDDICAAAGLSPSYLIRAFKERFGMTPHAYLVNRRVQYGQARLKRGAAIADAAIESGFADQSHFQRAFKQLLAATPGQYRGR